jgi:uncharacterized membrane protein YeiH
VEIPRPDERVVFGLLFQAFDLGGTFVFAVSGAIAGVRHRLDLFGVLVLAFAAATFGGITRDVLIGAVPPASLQDWRYLAVSAVAGVATFVFPPIAERFRGALLIYDAAGLGLFATTGAAKALAYGIGPVPAVLLGMLTGIGGGVVRDLLVSEVPAVLRTDIYAAAALAGAAVVVAGALAGWTPGPVAVAGATLCFAIRMVAIRWGWRLPVAGE